jgi:hypothetical protein
LEFNQYETERVLEACLYRHGGKKPETQVDGIFGGLGLQPQFGTKYKEKFLHAKPQERAAISKTIGWLRPCRRQGFNLLSVPGKLAASTPRQQQAESTSATNIKGVDQ